ncbi:MAG: NUDIX hydrolase [Patescibacteria group bacterium]
MNNNFPLAVNIIFLENQSILLLKRCNTGFNDSKWSVPAGRLEKNETIRQATIREAQEEVNLSVKISDFGTPLFMHHKDDRGERIYVFFLVKKWTGTATNNEPEKCSEIKWFNTSDLPSSLIDHVSVGINEIIKGTTYTEFGFHL